MDFNLTRQQISMWLTWAFLWKVKNVVVSVVLCTTLYYVSRFHAQSYNLVVVDSSIP